MSTEIQEAVSNVAITEKKRQYANKYRYNRAASGAFSDKVTPGIDYFADELLIQCDAPNVKNTYVDDCK